MRLAATAILFIGLAPGVLGANPTAFQPAQETTSQPASTKPQRPDWMPHPPTNAALLYYRSWLVAENLYTALAELDYRSDPDSRVPTEFATRLEQAQETIGRIIEAAMTPECDFGIEYEHGAFALLPHLAKFRQTARILALDARRLMELDEIEPAAERIAAIYGIAAHASQDRLLISGLVSAAIISLANRELEVLVASEGLTHEARERLVAGLDRLHADDPAGIRRAVSAEGEAMAYWMRSRFRGPRAGSDLIRELAEPALTGDLPLAARFAISRLTEAALDAQIRSYESYFDDVMSVWDAPDAEARIEGLEGLVADGQRYGSIARILAPSITRIRASATRVHADLLATRQLLHDARIKQPQRP